MATVEKTQFAEVIDDDSKPDIDQQQSENTFSINNNTTMIVHQPPIRKDIPEQRVPIYMTNNKTAFFVYPSDVTAADVKIMQHGIEGILLRINLEAEERDRLKAQNPEENIPQG